VPPRNVHARAGLRLLFLGSPGPYAAIVLDRVVGAGIEVAAVLSPERPQAVAVHPRPLSALHVHRPHDLGDICLAAGVPLLPVASAAEVAARVEALEPELVVCACFPFILGRGVLERPPLGCLNLHPSPLPAYRGPAPLFWQLRAGEPRSAVTLHRMSPRIDAGPVVAARELEAEPGISASELSARLARAGAELVVAAVAALARGTLEATPQDEARASYFPWPGAGDFRLSTAWPAERAFRFVRGLAELGRPFEIEGAGAPLAIRDALWYSAGDSLARPCERFGNDIRIAFSPGVVHAVPGPADWG